MSCGRASSWLAFQAGGSIRGIQPHYARRAAEALERPLQLSAVPANQLIEQLQRGDLDLIIGAPGQTEDGQQRVIFSKTYHTVTLGALVRQKDAAGYARALDVKKAPVIVGAETNTPGAEYMRVYCFGASRKTVVAQADAVAALQSGAIDLYVHDAQVLQRLANPPASGVTPLDIELLRLDLVWAMPRRERALQRRLNRLIDSWRAAETQRHAPSTQSPAGTAGSSMIQSPPVRQTAI
ncbi:MAG: transporter substrate-binding domain-containing protein [Lentisphaerae bacterium]|nr:transporter substrate-binding domain-containing protein [Lentisphaerota bacterium]